MSRIQQLLTLAKEELETADLLWKSDRFWKNL